MDDESTSHADSCPGPNGAASNATGHATAASGHVWRRAATGSGPSQPVAGVQLEDWILIPIFVGIECFLTATVNRLRRNYIDVKYTF